MFEVLWMRNGLLAQEKLAKKTSVAKNTGIQGTGIPSCTTVYDNNKI